MRKAFKKLLITAISFCAAGVLIFVIGMSVIGWDFYKLDTAEYTAKSYTPEAVVSSFELDVESFPVIVKRGDAVSLDYYEASDSVVSVETVNGVLKVRERQSRNPFVNMFNIGRFKHKYVLTVVDGGDVSISGGTISVTLDGLQASSLSIDAPNADVEINACKFDSLRVKSSNLDASIFNSEIADVKIYDCLNVDLAMSGGSGRALAVEATNLDAALANINYDSMNFDGINVDISANGVIARSIKADGTNSDLELQSISADIIELKSVNLTAEIVVNGRAADYGIYGDGMDLPPSRPGATDKRITLTGVNNDVSLRFTA